MKRLKTIITLLINISFGLTVLAQNSNTHKIASFENFPKNPNPIDIGKRLSERFMARPHSTFGAFKVTPPTKITYPNACRWYGQ